MVVRALDDFLANLGKRLGEYLACRDTKDQLAAEGDLQTWLALASFEH